MMLAPTAVAVWQQVYWEGFDSDPGWTTNSPTKMYWDSAAGRYHLEMSDSAGDYTYVQVPYLADTSYRLEFDIEVAAVSWAGDVRFGLGDSDMNTEQAATWYVGYSRGDLGRGATLQYRSDTSSGNVGGGYAFFYDLDTKYHNVITYDSTAESLAWVVTRVSDGTVMLEASESGVGTFTGMDRLYSGSIGDTYAPGATGEGYVDNVILATQESPSTSMLVVGDSGGNVQLVALDSGDVLVSTNLNGTAIGQLDVVDLDGDGILEVLATHLGVSDLPMYALVLASLTPFSDWVATDESASFDLLGHEEYGCMVWSGDFDGGGDLELIIPYNYGQPGGALLQVFSAVDGTRKCTIPQTNNWYGFVYQDCRDSSYRLIDSRSPSSYTHYMLNYDLSDGCNDLVWENTNVNTWKMGAIGCSMTDGTPRMWGGWYGRTLYVLDGDGGLLCSNSYGGSYEAEAVYAGDLRSDGTEVILVGGTYGTNHVRLDAVNLADCHGILWTFDDTTAHWAIHVVAVEDIDGDGVSEVYAVTPHTNEGSGMHPKYLAISGADGTLLWEVPYDYDATLVVHGRIVDCDGDGDLDILVIADNTVEGRDALTGELTCMYELGDNVTAFELAEFGTGTGDLNCDGSVDIFDIDAFVRAVTAPSQYAQEYPDCDHMLADCNHDGYADIFDIDAFVALIVGR